METKSLRRIGMVAIVGVALAGGCSEGHSQTSRVPAGNACDRKLVTQADAADILGAPVVEVKALAGDPQSCVLKTASGSITVMLRPNQGNMTVETWLQGRMNVSATPLQGVGERAAWVPALSEVVATKANLLCDVLTEGAGGSKAVVQQKAGALCNKIFASNP